MKLKVWIKSLLVFLFCSVGLAQKASAHNAVTYISEEAIAVGFVVILILTISLVCAVLGLFKTNKFIRVFAITGAVMSSLIFVFTSTFRGFDSFIPVALIITILLWLAIYFRKTIEVKTPSTSAFKVALVESALFLMSSMLLLWNMHRIMPSLEMRTTLFFTAIAFVALAIIYFGHRHYFTRLTQQGEKPTFSDGMRVSVYSIIIYSLVLIIHTVLIGFAQDYGFAPLEQILIILAKGAIPVLAIGALFSYFLIPKSTSESEEIKD